MATPPSLGATRTRVWRLALRGVTVLMLLWVVGWWTARRVVDRAVASAAAAVGLRLDRSVTVRHVSLTMVPAPTVVLEGVVVHGRTGEPDLLTVRRVDASLALWASARTRGRTVVFRQVRVQGVSLRILRREDGGDTLHDMVGRLGPAASAPARHAMVVERLSVTDGSVHLASRGRPTISLDRLSVHGAGLGSSRAFYARFEGALLGPTPNLHGDVAVAPGWRPQAVTVTLDPTDMAPVAPWLPQRGGMMLTQARVGFRARVAPATDLPGGLAVHATVTASAARYIRETEEVTLPGDLATSAEVQVSPDGQTVRVDGFTASLGALHLQGSGVVQGRGLGAIRALQVHARGLTLETLAVLVPAPWVPHGAHLSGPVLLDATVHGTTVDASVDLADATVMLPGLHKPAGTALSLVLQSTVDPAGVPVLDIHRAGLTVGPLALWVHGQLRSQRDMDLALDTGAVAMDGLLRLLPGLRHELPPGATVAGTVHATGTLRRGSFGTDGEVTVSVEDANVDTPSIALAGQASLHASVHGPDAHESVSLAFDGTSAHVRMAGRIDKAAGLPLRVQVGMDRVHRRVTVRSASVVAPGLSFVAHGEMDLATRTVSMAARGFNADLAALSAALPAVDGLSVPGPFRHATVRADVQLHWDARDPEATRLDLGALDLRTGWTSLRGEVRVQGTGEHPAVFLSLTGDTLDLDGLRPPAGTAVQVTFRVPTGLRVEGTVRLASVQSGATVLRDLDTGFVLADGRLAWSRLRVGFAGGQVEADNGWAELAGRVPRFHGVAHGRGLDLAKLAAAEDPLHRPAGHADVDADMTGDTTSMDSLTGNVRVLLTGLVTPAGWSPRATLVNPVLARASEHRASDGPAPMARCTMGTLAATAHVAGGMVQFTAPFTVATDEGTLRLEGSVGMDRSLDLSGSYTLEPAALTTATHGRFSLGSPLEIHVRVGGSLAAPRFEVTNLGGVVTTLIAARLRAIF